MIEQFQAIYENGGFRPIGVPGVSLSDGDLVRITVEPISQNGAQNVLDLAAGVYAGLSQEEIAEVEQIAMDRTSFFSS